MKTPPVGADSAGCAKRCLSQALGVAREASQALRTLRVPVVVALIACIAFILPPQINEVNRVIAQDIWYKYRFECNQSVLTFKCNHFDVIRESLFSYVGVILAAAAVAVVASRLKEVLDEEEGNRVAHAILSWAPAILSFAIVFACA